MRGDARLLGRCDGASERFDCGLQAFSARRVAKRLIVDGRTPRWLLALRWEAWRDGVGAGAALVADGAFLLGWGGCRRRSGSGGCGPVQEWRERRPPVTAPLLAWVQAAGAGSFSAAVAGGRTTSRATAGATSPEVRPVRERKRRAKLQEPVMARVKVRLQARPPQQAIKPARPWRVIPDVIPPPRAPPRWRRGYYRPLAEAVAVVVVVADCSRPTRR